jgi:hypothetical protein
VADLRRECCLGEVQLDVADHSGGGNQAQITGGGILPQVLRQLVMHRCPPGDDGTRRLQFVGRKCLVAKQFAPDNAPGCIGQTLPLAALGPVSASTSS